MPKFSFIPHMVSEKIFKHFYENRPFLLPRQPIKFTDLDKSHMKRRGILNKYFCKEKKSNIPNDLAEMVNFHFSHYKSMGTISCHSNQSSYPTGIKNTIYVEANVLSMHAKNLASSPIWFLRRRFLNIFTKIDPFCHPFCSTTNQIHRFGQKSYEM